MRAQRLLRWGSFASSLGVVLALGSGVVPGCAHEIPAVPVTITEGGASPAVGGGGPSGGALGGEASGGVAPGGEGGASTGGISSECLSGETLCSGECVADFTANPAHCGECNHACGEKEVCTGGVCICSFDRCGGTETVLGECVDLSSDKRHCGRCFATCVGDETCVDGACSCEGNGLTRCGSLCTDLDTDRSNCGECGKRCAEGEVCSLGACSEECQDPEVLCQDTDGTPICADLQTSLKHCGQCQRRCPADRTCTAGDCLCAPGLCGADCEDPRTSVNHCGQCDHACGAGTQCEEGVCVCIEGLTECPTEAGLTCADVTQDVANCGSCGNACPPGALCEQGQCKCSDGDSECTGEDSAIYCANLMTDDANCGACGTTCIAAAPCTDGVCVCDDAALTFCEDDCYDLTSTNAHCGSCENSCPVGEYCDSSACEQSNLVIEAKPATGSGTEINPSIRLCNRGTESITVGTATIRYWYSRDVNAQQIATMPWAQISTSTAKAVAVDPPREGGDYALEISVGAGSVAPNACTEFQVSVHATEQWMDVYDHSDDWSYQGPGAGYVLNDHITVYQGGTLVWGAEPDLL